MLKGLSDWISAASVGADLQRIGWLVPALQALHILAIAGISAPAFIMNLRLMGVGKEQQPLASLSAHLKHWIWWALCILAASGSFLIFIEPARPLSNPIFFVKLVLILLAALITIAIGHPLREDSLFWERNRSRRTSASAIAILSSLLWVSVICAGRWIAYTASL